MISNKDEKDEPKKKFNKVKHRLSNAKLPNSFFEELFDGKFSHVRNDDYHKLPVEKKIEIDTIRAALIDNELSKMIVACPDHETSLVLAISLLTIGKRVLKGCLGSDKENIDNILEHISKGAK